MHLVCINGVKGNAYMVQKHMLIQDVNGLFITLRAVPVVSHQLSLCHFLALSVIFSRSRCAEISYLLLLLHNASDISHNFLEAGVWNGD